MENTVHRFHRSITDRKVAGVCGGIAEYFAIDSLWVRLLFITLLLYSLGAMLLVYGFLCFMLPEDPSCVIPAKMKTYSRNQQNGKIAGVCSGLADYFECDPLMFRLAFFASVLFGGLGVVLYIVLWILT